MTPERFAELEALDEATPRTKGVAYCRMCGGPRYTWKHSYRYDPGQFRFCTDCVERYGLGQCCVCDTPLKDSLLCNPCGTVMDSMWPLMGKPPKPSGHSFYKERARVHG